MNETNKIKVGKQEVILDASKLEFSEITLAKYMEEEAGWYNHFGQRLAEAEYIVGRLQMEYDKNFNQKFTEAKADKGSDKFAEAQASNDEEVCSIGKELLLAKYNVKALQQHLRAWDKAHENAQSRNRMLIKEMDKITHTVWNSDGTNTPEEDKLEEILGKKDEE